jgi:hypothetical protein
MTEQWKQNPLWGRARGAGVAEYKKKNVCIPPKTTKMVAIKMKRETLL